MLFPAVTAFHNTLHVPICVVSADNVHKIHAAPFILPRGLWRIVWSVITCELDPTAPSHHFQFNELEGIKLNAVTGSGEVMTPPPSARISTTQWMAAVDNTNYDWGERVSYFINLEHPDSLVAVLVHDPVILVSKDPIEIPIG
jgi:hypothetical protein